MPAKITPSQAKNFVRRALTAIVDPPPSIQALQQIWDHFDSRCAYCDLELTPGRKQAHYDHLVSKGGNALDNFVLSCATCNEKEKLDKDWETFLETKAPTSEIFGIRRARIVEWRQLACKQVVNVDPALLNMAECAVVEVLELFEEKVEELRRAKLSR
ncbi:HNH endonuclease [Roseimicrobium sp. ORNL1]|uniref:HNH endonuclease n=1 Tax=Roseimicrobium sp. ORNL1 TaxID=2711231 RepID=UPI0013E146FA|nr:HNH endonuclease [Roseimicrobium sp. ORNL1]QIF04586.1 HNH endonuclease [Roseimicrobium sp. ORNL1]